MALKHIRYSLVPWPLASWNSSAVTVVVVRHISWAQLLLLGAEVVGDIAATAGLVEAVAIITAVQVDS
jgi:hypothetical protein